MPQSLVVKVPWWVVVVHASRLDPLGVYSRQELVRDVPRYSAACCRTMQRRGLQGMSEPAALVVTQFRETAAGSDHGVVQRIS